jgi:hypothetical protein
VERHIQVRRQSRRKYPERQMHVGDCLVALLVWFTAGIALWHFTIFLPDRFWQGIVGAFLGAVLGGIASGAAAQIAAGKGIGETDFATVLYALPGIAIGLAIVYAIGLRTEPA